jgi:hypothetical protein
LSRPYSKNLGALNKKFVTVQIFYAKKLICQCPKTPAGSRMTAPALAGNIGTNAKEHAKGS